MKRNANNLSHQALLKSGPLLAVFIGCIIGGLFMLLSGYNPIDGYTSLLQGAFNGVFSGDLRRLGDILLQSTPLILSGLSVALGFQAGVLNMGVSGQMYVGGFFAVLVGAQLKLPSIIHIPVVLIAGMIGGALWAYIPAILRVKYKTNEVVTTLLMNYVALELVVFLSRKFIPGTMETQSAIIHPSASLRVGWLTTFFNGSVVNLGLFLAVIMSILYYVFFNKTKYGFELKVVGANQHAGKYAGMPIAKDMVVSMLISGAMAGLAGVTYYLGYTNFIQLGILPSYGFDAIAVSLLGANTSVGIILSSLLFGILRTGGSFMTVVVGVPNELVDIIVSMIIYCSGISLFLATWLAKRSRSRSRRSGE